IGHGRQDETAQHSAEPGPDAVQVHTSRPERHQLMKHFVVRMLAALLLAGFASAQAMGDKPPVVMAPISGVQVRAGATRDINLDFRVGSEFHINSHTPKSPLLIPTVLKLDAPAPMTLGDVKYPAGQDMSFAFSGDEKLNVYSGDFTID